ncbi:MAG: T9SS type A sorting domain-containing protein [Actinobacteria bacterium]|nr:T9SS type A sorting domain-containing protein [Actinomycetota bacterium]
MKTLKIIMMAMLLTNLSFSQEFEDSPFGITESIKPIEEYVEMNSLGVKWVRQGGAQGLNWFIYSEQSNSFWKRPDELYSLIEENDMEQIVIVRLKILPEDINSYKDFLSDAVTRYPYVKVWEFEQELENGWEDTLENYALVLKESYNIVKKMNPEADVLFASMAGPWEIERTLIPVVDELNKIADSPSDKYFDIVSLHWSGKSDENDYKKEVYQETYYLEDAVNEFKSVLDARGYINIPIWISATSYNDGQPTEKLDLNPRTEKQQANMLFQMYIYPLAKGISKIFWITIEEHVNSFICIGREDECVDYYDLVGLINNPDNEDGKSHKKLAYYTYKKMTETLEGSDWDNIGTTSDGQGNIYTYKFTKAETGELVYIAWWDLFDELNYSEGDTKVISLEVGDVDSVRITETVPDAESGADLNENDYPAFFASETKPVTNGIAIITLGENPVFIELLDETGPPVPEGFRLVQNYPNPFNPQTTIEYQIPISSHMALRIFNVWGQEVLTLVNKDQSAGNYSVVWDGKDDLGKDVTSGIYFYQMRANAGKNSFWQTKKLLFLK